MGALTPIAELPDQIERWGDIAWKLDAGPYIDTERIGLDVGAAQRMIGFAGLRGATVSGYQGEQTQIQTNSVSVTGINADGSATGAGTASASKANTQRTTLEQQYDYNNGNMFEYRWPIAHIGIDRAEIASRIANDRRKHRDEPREIAWARHVDRALRSGIVDAALTGLVKDPWEGNKSAIVYFGFLEGLYVPVGDFTGAALLAAIFQMLPIVTTMIHDKTHPEHEHKRPPFKISLLPDGFQPDRLVVTALLAKPSRLIRPIKTSRR